MKKKRSSKKKLKRDAAREAIHQDKTKRRRGRSLLGHAVEVTPENTKDKSGQCSMFAVGSNCGPVNLASAMKDADSEGDVEGGHKKAYAVPFKTTEDKRDGSNFDTAAYGGALKIAGDGRDGSDDDGDDEGLKQKDKVDDNGRD